MPYLRLGRLTAAPVETGFGGGLSQTNMNYVPSSGDYPFNNAILYCDSQWGTYNSPQQTVTPDKLTARGIPTTVAGMDGGCFLRVYVPTQTEKPGGWTLRWTGSGHTMGLGAPVSLTTASGNSTTSPWRVTIADDAPNFYFDVQLFVHGGGALSDIQLIHDDDLDAHDAGELFTAKFLETFRELNFGCIRFLNWQQINTSNVAQWAYRKPTDYYSQAAYYSPPDLYAGRTTRSTAAYSVGIPDTHSSDGTAWVNGDAPKDKDTIIIQFNEAISSGTATLRVGTGGSTSAIEMVAQGCTALSTGGGNYPRADTNATLTYEAAIGKWIKFGGDTHFFNTGIDVGCSPETLLRLCREVGAHPWVLFPAFCLDPMSDYATGLVDFVYDNKEAWMVPRFEVVNEVWNPQFFASSYSQYMAEAHWGVTRGQQATHQWYGKVASTLGQYVAQKWGMADSAAAKAQTQYAVVCGVQTGTGNTFNSANESAPRLTSQEYMDQAAAAQSGYTKSRAKDWVTHIAPANYFNPLDTRGDVPVPYADELAADLAAVQFVIGSCSGGSLTIDSSYATYPFSGGYAVYNPAIYGRAGSPETPSLPNSTTLIIHGLGVPPGTTMTGTFPNYTTSTSFTLPAGWKLYAYPQANHTYLQEYVDSCDNQPIFNASTSGTLMTVHSVTSGTLRTGMFPMFPGGWGSRFIVDDGTLTGTGGPGTYRLDNPLGEGDITTEDCKGSWMFDLEFQRLFYDIWKEFALFHDVDKAMAYEGGYSPDYDPFAVSFSAMGCMKYLSKFVDSTALHPDGLAEITIRNYNDFTGVSDGDYTATFPSQYLVTGPYPSTQIWNMLETIYRLPKGGTYDAIVEYNN